MIYISDPYHIFNPHFCHLPQVLSPELAELLDGLLELHPEDRLCLGEFLGGVPLLGDFLELETRDWGKLGRRMGADVWCEPRFFSGICIGGQPFEQSEENAQQLAIFWSKSELECYKFEPDPFKTRAFIFDPELRCPVVNGYGDGAHICLLSPNRFPKGWQRWFDTKYEFDQITFLIPIPSTFWKIVLRRQDSLVCLEHGPILRSPGMEWAFCKPATTGGVQKEATVSIVCSQFSLRCCCSPRHGLADRPGSQGPTATWPGFWAAVQFSRGLLYFPVAIMPGLIKKQFSKVG